MMQKRWTLMDMLVPFIVHIIATKNSCIIQPAVVSYIRRYILDQVIEKLRKDVAMSSLLSYKNYNGTVEYSKEDKCLYGKVIGVKSLLSYEGDSVQELETDFQNVIDDYLNDCEERGIQPEQPYKGTFNVRISPDLHRTIATYAIEHGKSLNAAVEEAIEHMVG